MLTRAISLVSLPMLALLLAIPAHAVAAGLAEVQDSADCGHETDTSSKDQGSLPLFAPLPSDSNTASRLSAERPLPSASADVPPAAHIAICRASVTLAASPDGNAHLTVELSKPLPAGQLASHLVRRFGLRDGSLQLEVEAPEGNTALVRLSLPARTRTEVALVRGDLEILHLLGNAQIAVVKGNATLHLADSDFSTLECATILGGIRDRRPGGSSHGHMLSTWTARGTGASKIEFSAVSGDLILLPRTS